MPASQYTAEFTEKDLKGGGRYADLDVPADYEAILVDVVDHQSKTGNKGWKWTVDLGDETTFDIYTMFTTASMWKLHEMLAAFGEAEIAPGLNQVNPNKYIGMRLGVRVDWEDETEQFKQVVRCFPLTEPPAISDLVEPEAAPEAPQAEPIATL